MLEVKNLYAGYGKKNILSDVSFTAESGKLTCIIGANGSGKSTLLGSIAGAGRIKKSGSILYGNEKLESLSVKERAQKIAYMMQSEYSSWNYCCRDIILTGRWCHTANGFYSEKDYDIAVDAAKLLKIENILDKSVHEISGGQWQKVRLARALSQGSPVVLLDEPLSSLDFGYQRDLLLLIKQIAKEKNIVALISIHDLNLASCFADKLVLLCKGKEESGVSVSGNSSVDGSEPDCEGNSVNASSSVSGTVKEIFVPEILNSAYGTSFKFYPHPESGVPQIY